MGDADTDVDVEPEANEGKPVDVIGRVALHSGENPAQNIELRERTNIASNAGCGTNLRYSVDFICILQQARRSNV